MNGRPCWLGVEEMGLLGRLWADLLGDASPCSSECSLYDGKPLRLNFCKEEYNFHGTLFACNALFPSPRAAPTLAASCSCCGTGTGVLGLYTLCSGGAKIQQGRLEGSLPLLWSLGPP